MKRQTGLVGVFVCAALSALGGPAWGEVPPPNASVPQVMAELKRIEAAQARLQVDALRMEYQEAARARPADTLVRVFIAWCSMPSDDTWNQLKGYASVNPDNPWLHYGMGRVYLSWKMRDQAKAEFDTVLKKDPKFYPATLGLADLARQKEDWDQAEQLYKATLAVNDDATAWAGLGFMAAARGQGDAAREAFKKSIASFPEQPGVLERLSRLCVEAKDPATQDVVMKLVELQPKNREARKLLANLQFDAGDKKGAAASYEKLFRLGDPEIAIAQRLADIYREQGAAEDEERILELVARLDKTQTSAVMRLAELALAKKNDERARAQWLEALERDPKLAQAHFNLGQQAAAQNTLFEAAEHYLAAAELQGPGADEGKAEAEKLIASFELPKVSFTGGVDSINVKVSITLDKLWQKRVLLKPGLGGTLRIRVRVDSEGVVKGVDVVEDTVGDPMLTGHAYFALKRATWPKQKREPVFEFELNKKKGK